jgi:superfamily II DNA/RNA helicase
MSVEKNNGNIFKNDINFDEESSIIQSFSSWDELELNTDLLRGIYAYGFEKPSPIQSKAIYPILCGSDIIAQAQSGTGKTGSFTIGALSKVVISENTNQILIMVPTHELAHQITTVITSLASMMTGIRIKTIVGGSSINEDAEDMRKNTPHIIVGCPGRIYDMVRRKHINTNTLKLVILDEADEMLSSGFKDQVYNVFKYSLTLIMDGGGNISL